MTARALFLDAWESVRRNWMTVTVFIAVVCVSEAIIRLLSLALVGGSPPEALSPALRVAELALKILLAAVYSAAQAVCYARMGKDIDRPLWKCPSDWEALARFFTPWFILNLLLLLLWTLQGVVAAHDSAGGVLLLEFLIMLLYVLCVPIGACIVYGGGLQWQALGYLLYPLAKQFSLAVIPMLFGLIGFTLIGLVYDLVPGIAGMPLTPVLLSAPLALLDCLAFAAMWRVCMIQRDTPPDEDLDFF
ncbi:MAG TPA: hypothetical protein PKI11_16505 [Candidatus Hydrogenedentes bacterium]|nr:hypothetical protein [Candidatus Hydrogenedentota bacterium]HNT89014.1 hypothetical protein [Candidatus Hydrogenedentota bacterium]